MQKQLAIISLLFVWIFAVMLPPIVSLCAESDTVGITALAGEEEPGESTEIDFFEAQKILSGTDPVSLGFDINDQSLSEGNQDSIFQVYQDIQVPPPKAVSFFL